MAMMMERRKHKRTYAWESARILFHDRCVLRCTICDASAEGARVELANAFVVPGEFELTDRFGDAHACSAVWKTPNFIGIRFCDAGSKDERMGQATAADVEPRATSANRENSSLMNHEPG
jgi:hypothetical protein